MKNSVLIKSLLTAVCLPLLAGCIVVRDRHPYGGEVVVAGPEVPPPQVEVVPVCPGPPDVWLWIPGGWEWRGHWVWAGGHWGPRPHPGAVWIRSGWGWHGHRRVWVTGYWR